MSQGGWSSLSSLDSSTAVVFREFLSISALHRQLIRRAFAKHDIHPAQALCILVLSDRGEVTQSELADELLLARPSVTRLLQRMERAGLVSRQTDPADQRQVRVTLTSAGHDLQHLLHLATVDYVRRTVALLPEGERDELARILPSWRRLAEREAQL